MRHQLALQPVGELADHRIEVFQMLVEQVAQACQLIRVTELIGIDNLIKFLGIDAVEIAFGGIAVSRRLAAFTGRVLALSHGFIAILARFAHLTFGSFHGRLVGITIHLFAFAVLAFALR